MRSRAIRCASSAAEPAVVSSGYPMAISVDMTGSPLSAGSRTSPPVIQAAGRPVRLVRPG
jgi:hypothetical protein